MLGSNENDRLILCRALLDNGSQSHFVTSALISQLDIKKVPTHVIINDRSTSSTIMYKEAMFSVVLRLNNNRYLVTALVSPNITVNLPTSKNDTYTYLVTHSRCFIS